MVALARADRFARTGVAMAQDVDVRDLDLADRAGWTAEQWQRAEAAGLLVVSHPPLPQLVQEAEPEIDEFEEEEEDYVPVWRDELGEWVTAFPPPEDFDGDKERGYGDENYRREMTGAELEAWQRLWAAKIDPKRLQEAQVRDDFFGFVSNEPFPAPDVGEMINTGEESCAH